MGVGMLTTALPERDRRKASTQSGIDVAYGVVEDGNFERDFFYALD